MLTLQNRKLILHCLVVSVVSFIWSKIYWLNDLQFSSTLMSLDMQRPFVYRQLIPFIVRGLSQMGVRIDVALCLVVTGFGVGLYLALRKLYFHYYPQTDKGEIYVLVSLFMGMFILGQERWYYDLATAFFFTLGIYYLVHVENWKFLVVVFLSSFNRETTILLILLYGVFWLYYRKYGVNYLWWMTPCQLYVYGLITYGLHVMFQYNDGVIVLIEPMQNLQKYATHPLQTVMYILILAVILLLVFRNWNSKFFSLRLMFVVLFPILFVLYLVCGQSFEVRTFWECFSVAALLIKI